MDINIDALYNILKKNQGDVTDAMGLKKKTIVVNSDPLALIAEKTKEEHFAKDCKKVKVTDYEYYKTKMLLAKKDKDEQVLLAEDQAWMESSSDLDQEINANMVFMAQIKKVLSDSEASSSSADEKISEVSYYLSESESESEYETSEYYDNTTAYGLFVNDNDDQEIFHDCENFPENLIESQIDHNESDVDHNNSERIDKLIRKFNKKIVKCLKRIKKANQQKKDFEKQNKDLQDKYDVLKNQETIFEMNNKELNEQLKVLIEKNKSLLAQTIVLKDQLQFKHIVIDTHVECFENPSYFCKAKDLRPTLYDERVISLGYTPMFLIHSDEALEIEKFKRARENKIKFAYDYGNLNASYVNEKINFSDDYFQEIINPDFEKIDSPFQQTSSLKPLSNLFDENNLFIFDDESVKISPVSKMPFKKKPRDSLSVRSKRNFNKSLPRTVHRLLPKMQPLAEPVAKWIPRICLWIIDSGCSKHMTGNCALLTNFVDKFLGTVCFGNNDFAVIDGYGDGLEVSFRKSTCFVRNEDGVDLLTGDRSSNLYTIFLNEVASNSSTCLLANAFSSQSWLWHQRLSHLNFATIN
nr:hypothetical protein [Tanacetum cinerariifolium]